MITELADLLLRRTMAGRVEVKHEVDMWLKAINTIISSGQVAECDLPVPKNFQLEADRILKETYTSPYIACVEITYKLRNRRQEMLKTAIDSLQHVIETRQQGVIFGKSAIAAAQRRHVNNVRVIRKEYDITMKDSAEAISTMFIWSCIAAVGYGVIVAIAHILGDALGQRFTFSSWAIIMLSFAVAITLYVQDGNRECAAISRMETSASHDKANLDREVVSLGKVLKKAVAYREKSENAVNVLSPKYASDNAVPYRGPYGDVDTSSTAIAYPTDVHKRSSG